MRLAFALAAMLALGALAGCGLPTKKNDSEREWAKAECRQILDSEARTKCLERVDKE
jgi:hypothetical protein